MKGVVLSGWGMRNDRREVAFELHLEEEWESTIRNGVTGIGGEALREQNGPAIKAGKHKASISCLCRDGRAQGEAGGGSRPGSRVHGHGRQLPRNWGLRASLPSPLPLANTALGSTSHH